MILVTRFSALGDIAMTIPALYDACRSNPERQFLMLTRKGPAKMFVNRPDNLRVAGIDLDEYKGAAGLWRLASRLADAGVTMMVDLHDVLRTKALRGFLATRGIRSTHIDKGRREKKNLTRANHKHIVPLKNSIERYRDTFTRAGLRMEKSFSTIFPDGADPALFAAATAPKKEGERWIGLAPFARHKGKIYPPELMEQAIADMTSKQGVKIFLFAGGPEEEARAALWAAKYPGIVNLAPLHMGFEAEMALMSHCDAVISMDSANMHLASLAGTRVISIWGATHPYCGFMGFNQNEKDTLQLEMSCRPCSVFGDKPCRRGDYHCLNGITPQRIVKAVGLSVAAALLLPLSAIGRPGEPTVFNPTFPVHTGMPGPQTTEVPSPESPEINIYLTAEAADALATGKFQDAYSIYLRVVPTRLPLSMRAGYWYGVASATARLGLLDETARAATALRSEDGATGAVHFLDGYLAYRKGHMAEARRYLSNTPPEYVPGIYLSQIDFSEGKWADAARRATESMAIIEKERSGVNAQLLPELTRTAALSYFKMGERHKARTMLEKYMDMCGESPSDDARYALGQIEYEDGNNETARKLLSPLTATDGQFAQGASYTLAQMEARDGHDREAALGFSRAARLNFDPNIGQNAIYNYIAAGTNGATVPFASAADMYESYLANGRATGHDDQLALRFAREYYHEGNYAKALECVELIAVPDAEAISDKQKILYQLGRMEVAARKYSDAIRHLAAGATLRGGDSRLAAECRLWLGDARYAEGNYTKAAEAYSSAIKGLSGANRTLALYNYAYSLFSQDKFSQAAKAFADALAARPALPVSQRDDAKLRLADCRFYTGNYAEALKGYEEGTHSGSGADYAAMRQAVALGLTGDLERKIRILSSFASSYPGSRWIPDAMLELGNTYAALDRQDEAASAFARITASHPASPQARKATLAMAQSLVKKGDTTGAMEAYRNVIRSWPSSEEAMIANDDMMRLSASEGSIREYAEFLKTVKGAPSIDSEKMEALAFEAAENAWADDITDIRRLREYLTEYPDGRFVAQALLDIAESELQSGNRAEALSAYMRLEQKGGADYAPEAYVGVMRTTDDPHQRGEYASKVLATGGVEPEAMEEARLFNAIGMLSSPSSRAEAVSLLTEMASHPDIESGARAAVELGEWQLKQGQLGEALKTLTAFTDAGSPHSYWLARGFIALSDTYRKKGQTTLANEYLRSLKANYPGSEPDIINAISSRLKK